jgi:predicted RNA-binding Zn ribbon-like protein
MNQETDEGMSLECAMLNTPTDDLDIAVELINTVYLLADPPDRLTSTAVFQGVLTGLGHEEWARTLREEDLETLCALRERLRAVFGAPTPAEAAGLLNAMLREGAALPQLVPDEAGGLVLRVDAGLSGVAALAARLPIALAAQVAAHGIGRLGICSAAPCECVFVDRTRAGTRRYCCDGCNDRAAAAAYRRRKRPDARAAT